MTNTSTIMAALLITVPVLGEEKAPTKVENAAWLAGRWQSTAGVQPACEEHWSVPAGKAMVGMFRLVNNERPSVYELLLLEEETDGVWMRMRHFRPQMAPMEQEPMKLKLISASESKLVFEGATNNRPRRVTYALVGEELTATVETERNGMPTQFSLTMRRAK